MICLVVPQNVQQQNLACANYLKFVNLDLVLGTHGAVIPLILLPFVHLFHLLHVHGLRVVDHVSPLVGTLALRSGSWTPLSLYRELLPA